MKKIVLLTSIIFTACSLQIKSEAYDNGFLSPINKKKYEVTSNLGETSYIFFAKSQTVLINDKKNTNANGIYKLTESISPTKDTAVFKLQGTGNLKNSHLALKITPENDTFTTKISVQGTREQAHNSLNSNAEISVPVKIISPTLEILATLGSWIKTSRAGIFDPTDTETWIFSTEENTLDNIAGLFTRINPTINNGLPNEYRLTFQTNASDTSTILQYLDGGKLNLLGIVVDLESPKIQANFYINNVLTADQIPAEVNLLSQILEKNFIWEFGISSDIKTPNGSLDPLDKITWVRINANKTYSPQDREIWNIVANQEVINIQTSSIGHVRTDVYLMIRTEKTGVYQLSSENLNDVGVYHDKYFGFKKTEEDTVQFAISDDLSSIDTILANNQGTSFGSIQTSKERTFSISAANIESRNLNINYTSGSGNRGRSGFGLLVSEEKIWLFGGYTRSHTLFATAPNFAGGSVALPQVEQNIVVLDNLKGSLNEVTAKALPDRLYANPSIQANIQQAQATILKTVQGTETFFVFGSGSVVNDRLFLNNRGGDRRWQPRTLNTGVIFNRFNGTLYSYGNATYLAGGSVLSGSSVGPTPNPGDFKQEIIKSETGSSWELHITDTSQMWSARTLPQVFVIEDEIILVGGYTKPDDEVVPVNDVWSSKDGGRTWTKIRDNDEDTRSANSPPKAPSGRVGLLPGFVYGNIIFMFDPIKSKIIYSTDRGRNWIDAGALGSGNLFGASLAVYNNHLYLIGGQDSVLVSDDALEMNQIIKRIPISFETVPSAR